MQNNLYKVAYHFCELWEENTEYNNHIEESEPIILEKKELIFVLEFFEFSAKVLCSKGIGFVELDEINEF